MRVLSVIPYYLIVASLSTLVPTGRLDNIPYHQAVADLSRFLIWCYHLGFRRFFTTLLCNLFLKSLHNTSIRNLLADLQIIDVTRSKTRTLATTMMAFIAFILLTAVSVNSFFVTTVSASESSPYDSGYNHGCDDAGISDPSDRYINQPEKGPSFHTEEFMSGYDAGFSGCRVAPGDRGFESENPSFESPPQTFREQPPLIAPPVEEDDRGGRGDEDGNGDSFIPDSGNGGGRYYEGWNWRQICSNVSNFLSESCSDLVTPDGNALTEEGKRALERIACGAGALLQALLGADLLALLQGASC